MAKPDRIFNLSWDLKVVETFIFIDASFISGPPTHLFNSLFLEFEQISKDSCPHTFSPQHCFGGGRGRGSESQQSRPSLFQILEHRVLCSYLTSGHLSGRFVISAQLKSLKN